MYSAFGLQKRGITSVCATLKSWTLKILFCVFYKENPLYNSSGNFRYWEHFGKFHWKFPFVSTIKKSLKARAAFCTSSYSKQVSQL